MLASNVRPRRAIALAAAALSVAIAASTSSGDSAARATGAFEAVNVPASATELAERGASSTTPPTTTPPELPSEVLFAESFDDLDDWTSADGVTPDGWFRYRADPRWAPSTGHPDRHEPMEITAANVDKARGGSGKSAVFWRESIGDAYRNDKILAYKTSEGQRELYVEFWIRFSPDWTAVTPAGTPNTNKVFRVYAHDDLTPGSRPFRYFEVGDNGPILLWNYSNSAQYGLRNFQALRGGPYGENYYMTRPEGWPRQVNNGDSSLNFTGDTVGQGRDGTTPQIPDRVNGGFISDNLNQTVSHAQIFGDPADERWTKIAYHVSMNSAPGVADGSVTQWIDDEQVLHNDNLPWIGPTDISVDDVLWNIVGIGGNDYFGAYPVSDRHEEWYAIDDVLVATAPPEHLR